MRIHGSDERLQWRGAVSIETLGPSVRPWRLPHAEADLFPSPHHDHMLWQRAEHTAGVRLALRTDSPSVRLGVQVKTVDARPFALCVADEYLYSSNSDSDSVVVFDRTSGVVSDLEIWFPHFSAVQLDYVELADGAVLEPVASKADRSRWTAYGSSITQCRTARTPAETWPSLVARARGVDLTCLGFGGCALLDPMVARVIRDHPADQITMGMGINLYATGALNVASLQPAVIGFVMTVRDGHPDAALTVVSPLASPAREEVPGHGGLSLAQIRSEVAAAVSRLTDSGVAVRYVDGRELMAVEDAELLVDGLHPGPEGYRVVAERALALDLVR